VTGSAKILAVDDEPDFEALLKQRFRREIRSGDYAFRFARHGEEALAVLAEDPEIELLLLDINMPVMDGLTLLSVLQQRHIAVRAIIVSAYGDMDNIRAAMNRGAFDFVTKPSVRHWTKLRGCESSIAVELWRSARARTCLVTSRRTWWDCSLTGTNRWVLSVGRR
jgi:DNA-binding NtrC family response regulator